MAHTKRRQPNRQAINKKPKKGSIAAIGKKVDKNVKNMKRGVGRAVSRGK